MGAGAVAGATLASGAIGAGASLLGSSQASSAAKQASDNSLKMYEQTRSDLSPYTTAGQSAMTGALNLAQGSPTGTGPDYVGIAAGNMPSRAGAMTEAELQQTPGYQFTLGQGLKMTQAANAAKGLGVSGAALKGAATYATGLADQTYQNRFNEAQQSFADYLNLNQQQQGNLQNQFSRLQNVASIGESAGAQTGSTGASLNNTSANALISSGQSAGAGTVSAGNALSNAINNYAGYQYWSGQTGGYGTNLGTVDTSYPMQGSVSAQQLYRSSL